jgi:predicted phage baseplate assembly protein
MPFTPMNVDDRTFDDLVAEAKRRIAAYLPEWTDHNDSDPGITLVQLFAWLTETALFRLNRVPDDRMYVSFLNLIGLGPAPAVAARAVVELQVTSGSGLHTLSPFELRLSAPGESDEIAFEADAPVSLLGAAIGVVLVDDGISVQRSDVTKANSAGDQPFPPFGPTRIAGRALYLGLDAKPAAGPPLLLAPGATGVYQLYVAAEEKPVAVVPASTSYGKQSANLEGDVRWEGKVDDERWVPLEVIGDETRGLTQSGFVRVRLTSELSASREPGDPEQGIRFWIRAVAGDTSKPETRSIRYIIGNAVRVRQWRTYARELLVPGSDGEPRQTRKVKHPPILRDGDNPVVLEVNEPDAGGTLVWQPWSEVDDLATRSVAGQVASAGHPLDVFRVTDDRAGIELGDGLEGRIPPRGPNNLRLSYRSGGGAAGNVAAGQLSLAVSIPGVDGVTQRERALGGVDEESVEDARRSAPGRIRSQERAVTAADFEVVAREHAGVARASALNRYHPRVPSAPVTGAITLVVVPPRVGEDNAPAPSQLFLDGVAALLEPFRVLTTELFVVGPRYRKIKVDVEVDVRSPLDAAEVRGAVVAKLKAFLDPISGGSEQTGWPLGRTIAYGEVLSAVLSVPKVAAVRALTIALDGMVQPACSDVVLGGQTELPASDNHQVRIHTDEVRRPA